MKLASLTALVFAVLVCGSVMGCSGGRTAGPDSGRPAIDTGVVVRPDAPFTPIDAPISSDAPVARPDTPTIRTDGGSRMCVASCTTDSQCATSCPANPLGANCCDTIAGVCYAAMVAVCPVSMGGGDAGGSGT